MGRLEVLDNVEHHDLRVRLGYGAQWGDAINQVIVLPTEYEDLQREYPIVIRKEADGRYQTAALLGLDVDENLFLSPDGGWRAGYVPAARRLGPFKLGPPMEGTNEVQALIDVDDPRVGGEEGAPLFLPHGGRAPYLEQTLRTLRRVRLGLAAAQPMFAALDAHGLIQPTRLEITVEEELRYDVPEVFVIDGEALARLDGAALESLHRPGFLRAAFMLSASLGAVDRLIQLKRERLSRRSRAA